MHYLYCGAEISVNAISLKKILYLISRYHFGNVSVTYFIRFSFNERVLYTGADIVNWGPYIFAHIYLEINLEVPFGRDGYYCCTMVVQCFYIFHLHGILSFIFINLADTNLCCRP